jgi:ATP-dependent DNA ligase
MSRPGAASTGSRSALRLSVISVRRADFFSFDKQLKKDYLAGVGDSLDLVVVGGYYGKGKRTNVYGAFLLACYDADSEEYQTICKIGTGFSEEALAAHYAALQPLETEKARGDVKVGGAKPDVWFEPKVVWEVLTADLSLSPVYTAAQGLVGLPIGMTLLFPMAYLSMRLTNAVFHCGFLASFGSGMTKTLMMRRGRSR